jgi:hypothetical protein
MSYKNTNQGKESMSAGFREDVALPRMVRESLSGKATLQQSREFNLGNNQEATWGRAFLVQHLR